MRTEEDGRRLTGTSYNYLILKGHEDITRINNTKSWSYDTAWEGLTALHILLLAASTQLF